MNYIAVYSSQLSEASSELQDHVDGASCLQVVVGDLHLISQLFASENQSDLVNHNSFFLLQSLLHHQDRVVSVEVEALLSASQGLYKR